MDTPPVRTFVPKMHDFKNFDAYIRDMEYASANQTGMAKVIPPRHWVPRKMGYREDSFNINLLSPTQQAVIGREGVYLQVHAKRGPVALPRFRKMAQCARFKAPDVGNEDVLEQIYWSNITEKVPIYVADVKGSLIDPEVQVWNLNKLGTILDHVKEDYGVEMKSINSTYLSFGMWKTSSPWHLECMDLYSINYLHFGHPKTWYCVPPAYARRFEDAMAPLMSVSERTCDAFFNHRNHIIAPYILDAKAIPYQKVVQKPGEFIITFPSSYHASFDHGFNCSEITNFATRRWIEYGKRRTSCNCTTNIMLKSFSMDTYVRQYQAPRYTRWRIGQDYGIHPEPPNRYMQAPFPIRVNQYVRRREGRRASATLELHIAHARVFAKSVRSAERRRRKINKYLYIQQRSQIPADEFAVAKPNWSSETNEEVPEVALPVIAPNLNADVLPLLVQLDIPPVVPPALPKQSGSKSAEININNNIHKPKNDDKQNNDKQNDVMENQNTQNKQPKGNLANKSKFFTHKQLNEMAELVNTWDVPLLPKTASSKRGPMTSKDLLHSRENVNEGKQERRESKKRVFNYYKGLKKNEFKRQAAVDSDDNSSEDDKCSKRRRTSQSQKNISPSSAPVDIDNSINSMTTAKSLTSEEVNQSMRNEGNTSAGTSACLDL